MRIGLGFFILFLKLPGSFLNLSRLHKTGVLKSFLVPSGQKLSILYFKSLRRFKHTLRWFNHSNIKTTKFPPPAFFPLHSLKGSDAGNGIRVFVPDVGMFIASLTIWLVCRNIVQKPVTEEAAQYNLEFENEESVNLTLCLFLL